MLSFGFQKHQPYLSSSFQTFKYVRRTLIHAFIPPNTSCTHCLLLFNLEKHHLYFAFRLLKTVDFIYCLFWNFLRLNTYTVPCFFVYSIHKRHCYFSVSTLTSKNISSTLFNVCLSLNIFFLPISGILTCKGISHTYPVAVYTLNTRSTSFFFLNNHKKRSISISCCSFAFKTSTVPFF